MHQNAQLVKHWRRRNKGSVGNCDTSEHESLVETQAGYNFEDPMRTLFDNEWVQGEERVVHFVLLVSALRDIYKVCGVPSCEWFGDCFKGALIVRSEAESAFWVVVGYGFVCEQ